MTFIVWNQKGYNKYILLKTMGWFSWTVSHPALQSLSGPFLNIPLFSVHSYASIIVLKLQHYKILWSYSNFKFLFEIHQLFYCFKSHLEHSSPERWSYFLHGTIHKFVFSINYKMVSYDVLIIQANICTFVLLADM